MTNRARRKDKTGTAPNQAPPKLEVRVSERRVPKLPHERDESAETQSQRSKPRSAIRRAAADLKDGQLDTDRGPETNRLYKRLKANR